MAKKASLKWLQRIFVLIVLAVWSVTLWLTVAQLMAMEDELPALLPGHQRPTIYPPLSDAQQQELFAKEPMPGGLKFLVFQGDLKGQGIGNRMNGLLSAHLLGEEFNRTVCVSPAFDEFLVGFQPVHPSLEKCPRVFRKLEKEIRAANPTQRIVDFSDPPADVTITMINFEGGLTNECDLKAKLASETPVWFLRTNMYPRWRSIPENYFETFYQPTDALQQYLPQPYPKTVVHLRKEDKYHDHRNGLDDASLKALGDFLRQESHAPYLVTNNVEWYDYFEKEYRWTHPQWEKVVHSVYLNIFPSVQQPQRGRMSRQQRAKAKNNPRKQQTLELWSDWYTCSKAQAVYHTHSDFSASAIHWRDPHSQASRIIRGYNETTQQLEFIEEWWRQSPLYPPLKDRHGAELLNCDAATG